MAGKAYTFDGEFLTDPVKYLDGIIDELEKAQKERKPPEGHTIFALYDLRDTFADMLVEEGADTDAEDTDDD
tara:strand:- start:3235 stop:3450 length:216 start_codon:yes stop_codon:yes gene_type:complete